MTEGCEPRPGAFAGLLAAWAEPWAQQADLPGSCRGHPGTGQAETGAGVRALYSAAGPAGSRSHRAQARLQAVGRSRYRAWGLAGAVLVLAAAGCGGGSPGAPPVRLSVLTGGRVRATATLQRRWQVTVSAQAVRQDGFDGLLYTSAAVRPGAPAVVVLGGAEGGYDAVPAAALAMADYPALALAYFGEPGLPQCLCSIPLEYFARAISWLRAQPAGRGRPVVLYGASRGAEAVLLLASYLPHLADGVVASSPTAVINGAVSVVPGAAWTFGGQPLVPVGNIPVTRIRVPLLMGDGGQDAVLGLRGSGQHHHGRTARLPRPRAGHQPVLPPAPGTTTSVSPRTSRSSPLPT